MNQFIITDNPLDHKNLRAAKLVTSVQSPYTSGFLEASYAPGIRGNRSSVNLKLIRPHVTLVSGSVMKTMWSFHSDKHIQLPIVA